MKNEVSLRINGVEFGGWLDVEITAGIERLARDFRLSITRTWPGSTNIATRIKPGDICEVFIDNDKMLTGYVDATPISYNSNTTSVGINGRSKTADLVDCSANFKSGQWRNSKIERIAADLAKPYGISIKTEIDTGSAISDHQIDTGETVFESLVRLIAIRQLLSTDNANGDLVFIKVGSGGKASTALEFGQNILDASSSLDCKDSFSHYTVKGQRSGNDNDFADTVAGMAATIKNDSIKRYRNLIIQQSGNITALDCQQRMKYERDFRNARALETTYTVQGWRQKNGDLWLPNQLVHVMDPVIGFDDDLLITEVSYKKGESGTTTTIKVAPKEGYTPSPEVTKKDKDKKSGKGSGSVWAEVK